MKQRAVGYACLVASVGVHGALLGARSHPAPPRARPATTSVVRFSVAPLPPPPAPLSPPTASPPPLKAKRVPPRATPAPQPVAAEPEATPPPELTGTTLVSDVAGAAFMAPEGSGSTRDGAVRTASGSSGDVPSPPARRGPPVPPPPVATPLSMLSRKPMPPPLENALQRNYPARARSQGQSGEAKVRARIEPNGKVTLAKVTFESSGGFGDACRSTLLASTWSTPLDARGRPVATWVTYRCKFRIDD